MPSQPAAGVVAVDDAVGGAEPNEAVGVHAHAEQAGGLDGERDDVQIDRRGGERGR